jgi:hypothetical protein
MSFSSFSTGTKLASKTQKNSKKFKKIPVFELSTGTKSSITAQKNFSKNRQDVFSTRYQP